MRVKCHKYCRPMIGCLFCVLAILSVYGCSSPIDREAIADRVRRTEPQVQEFKDVFPDAEVYLNQVYARGFGKPDPRDQLLQVRSNLKDGCLLWMSRHLHVESSGVNYEWLGQEWRYYLKQPASREIIALDEAEFDALLAARGDTASLKPFGIMPPMDLKKVIDRVRELHPPAGRLHEVFHDACWTDVNKKVRNRNGFFYSTATLAEDVQLSVSHDIRIAKDGIGVELIKEPGKDSSGKMALYFSSARPDERLINLTSDQFDKIVAAKGDLAVVEQVWKERFQAERKLQHADEGLPEYTTFAGESWGY